MTKSKRIIEVARKKVITGHLNDALPVVAKKMVDSWVSTVLIEENGKPVGIVTDGIIFRLIAKGRNPMDYVAKDVMVSPVQTIHMNTPISQAEDEFLKSKVSRLAVIDDEGTLVGIVSQKDVDRFAAYSYAERLVHHRHEILD
ncbi:MAG: CBS domain-containing protein [Candidatus Hermodarchaeia archaeon]